MLVLDIDERRDHGDHEIVIITPEGREVVVALVRRRGMNQHQSRLGFDADPAVKIFRRSVYEKLKKGVADVG